MAWAIMAKGTSLEEFQASQPPYSELAKGTKLRLTIETPWWAPIAPLADLFGAEWVAQKLLAEGGATVVGDVEGVGWHTIIVHMEADPAWLVPLIWCIAIVVAGIAFLIAVIRLEADIPEMVKWGAIALVALAAIVLMSRRKEPKEKAPT